jgi:hypothetical protein
MDWQHLIAALTGIGLAAACGFRVFVPPLLAGLAFRHGWLDAPDALEWMASTPALVALGLATLVEVVAYKIPWLDNALDAIASPTAVLAGLLLASGFFAESDSWFLWILSAIAAVGAAGGVQAATVAARAGSTATTGGLANPLVALAELALSVLSTLAALLLPLLFALVVLAASAVVAAWLWRRRRRKLASA